MLNRMLPGLLVSALLALAFCHYGEASRRRKAEAASVAARDAGLELVHQAVTFTPQKRSLPTPVAAATSVLYHSTTTLESAVQPISGAAPTLFGKRRFPPRDVEIPERGPSERVFPSHEKEESSIKESALSKKLASENALATPIVMPESFEAELPGIPMGAVPPPAFSGSLHSGLPSRGVYAWGRTERIQEKQKLYGMGYTQYTYNGSRHSVGVDYDWSMRSTLGISADLVEGRYKSGHFFDNRENSISGYRFGARYETTVFDSWIATASGFVERYEIKGKGSLGEATAGGVTYHDWIEDKHNADGYGLSLRLGLPVLWGNDFKILHEIGVDYRSLRTREHAAALANHSNMIVPERKSTSVSIPISVTVRKDYIKTWGIVTPRANLGYTLELDNGATGVRTMHAASASQLVLYPGKFHSPMGVSDRGDIQSIHLGVGLEVKTVSGWELAADYRRGYSGNFTNNAFSLELGRCF